MSEKPRKALLVLSDEDFAFDHYSGEVWNFQLVRRQDGTLIIQLEMTWNACEEEGQDEVTS